MHSNESIILLSVLLLFYSTFFSPLHSKRLGTESTWPSKYRKFLGHLTLADCPCPCYLISSRIPLTFTLADCPYHVISSLLGYLTFTLADCSYPYYLISSRIPLTFTLADCSYPYYLISSRIPYLR